MSSNRRTMHLVTGLPLAIPLRVVVLLTRTIATILNTRMQPTMFGPLPQLMRSTIVRKTEHGRSLRPLPQPIRRPSIILWAETEIAQH